MRNVLVAGVGNIFFTDDGFGPAVAAQLLRTPMPTGVRVVDYGIRGVHLSYDLLDGVDALVLIDAVPAKLAGDDRPGTVVTMTIGPDQLGDGQFDAHGMSPVAVLGGLGSLGGELPPTHLIGCVPADVGDGIGLSAPVAAAVEVAAAAVITLVGRLVDDPADSLRDPVGG